MDKSQRSILEPLSLRVFGNKHFYKKLEQDGILHKDPSGGPSRRLYLSFEGIKHYLEESIRLREEFIVTQGGKNE